MPGRTWPARLYVCIYPTSPCKSALLQMPAEGGRCQHPIAVAGPANAYVRVNTILDLLKFSFGRYILEIPAVQVSDYLHTVDISVVVNKPTRTGSVKFCRKVRIRVGLPWALGHSKGAGSENCSDDTLDEQGYSPGPVRFNKGREVINPLRGPLRTAGE